MQPKYQIFISSTYDDLKNERRIVIEKVLNLKHIPVGMELFQAANESQWSYIQKRIKECDYYVLIVAERYGSIGHGGKSFTQMEYEFAIENGVPVAAFLLSDDAAKLWPNQHVEADKKKELTLFKDLCRQKMVTFWNSGDDLGSKVITSLLELMEVTPRVGWVRADSVANDKALNEIAKLSEEKRSLQEEVQRLAANNTSLMMPPDMVHRKNMLSDILMVNLSRIIKVNGKELKPDVNPNISLLDVFLGIYQAIAVSVTEFSFNNLVIKHCGFDGWEYTRLFPEVVNVFAANGLVEGQYVQTEDFQQTSIGRHYVLTAYGREFAMHLERLPSVPNHN